MEKTIFNYDSATGEFTGKSKADSSPLEPGIYLIPANATEIPVPETGEHEAAVFRDGAWSVQPDWRGCVLYSTTDGSPVTVSEIGPRPGGTTEMPRPSEQHVLEGGEWKVDEALKRAAILAAKKAERQAIVDAIVVTVLSGKVFDGNEEAQSRMSRAIQIAEIAGITSTTWVLANNVPTVVTLPELKEALVLSMQAMGAVWAMPYEAQND